VDVVMGVVSLPIPTFQTNQGPRALARAEVTVAEAELTADRQLLAGQVAEAHSEVAAAAKRTRTYGNEILPRFEENLGLLRRSFELGEIDILALSTGRERFLRIQSDALDAQVDYFVALSNLERVVGVDLWHDEHHEETRP
jgi:cobalt-zinc-cadmium efflux system outer membrane protein